MNEYIHNMNEKKELLFNSLSTLRDVCHIVGYRNPPSGINETIFLWVQKVLLVFLFFSTIELFSFRQFCQYCVKSLHLIVVQIEKYYNFTKISQQLKC